MEEILNQLEDLKKIRGISGPLTDKWFILDLDQTFIATQDNRDIDDYKSMMRNIRLRDRLYFMESRYSSRRGDGERFKFWGVIRPHTREMLKFLLSYGNVGVWTAATDGYAKEIVDRLFDGLSKPQFLFTRKQTIMEPVTIKPLAKLFKKYPKIKASNALALDDNPTTISENQDNGILIPAYEVSSEKEYLADDKNLIYFARWLMKPKVIDAGDVRTLKKDKIFS